MKTLFSLEYLKLLGSIVCFFILGWIVSFCNITFAFLMTCFFVLLVVGRYLQLRDQKIKALRAYLDQLNQGSFQYDISAYQEGELAKLQSTLNKTTVNVQNMNLELLKSKAYLTQSLEDIAHQLKTPLASLLILNELQDLDNELVSMSHDQIMRLKYLIESLLKLVKLDTQSLVMNYEMVEMKMILAQSIQLVKPVLDEKGIRIVFENDMESSAYIDVNQTIEALTNVLNNKAYYARSVIYIEMINHGIDTLIKISDDGPSIPDKEQLKIFERFYSGANRSSKSIGIGLAIARDIMRQQKGDLKIEDQNTFVFKMTRYQL